MSLQTTPCGSRGRSSTPVLRNRSISAVIESRSSSSIMSCGSTGPLGSPASRIEAIFGCRKFATSGAHLPASLQARSTRSKSASVPICSRTRALIKKCFIPCSNTPKLTGSSGQFFALLRISRAPQINSTPCDIRIGRKTTRISTSRHSRIWFTKRFAPC